MKYRKPLLFIALGLFGVYTIEFGVVGILPVIIERFHITAAQAGFLVSSFALIIALFGPFMVLLMSRFNRKRIMIVSLMVFAVISFLSAYASNFYLLVVLRIIPALFHPVYFSLAFVAATALYPPEKATLRNTRLQWDTLIPNSDEMPSIPSCFSTESICPKC
ncbi:UNVERIFIED_CONTAM: putative MFS family arabinose efflux permease [Paenibacillus sp. PvR008]